MPNNSFVLPTYVTSTLPIIAAGPKIAAKSCLAHLPPTPKCDIQQGAPLRPRGHRCLHHVAAALTKDNGRSLDLHEHSHVPRNGLFDQQRERVPRDTDLESVVSRARASFEDSGLNPKGLIFWTLRG